MCNGEFYDKEPSGAFDFFFINWMRTQSNERPLSNFMLSLENIISHSNRKFKLKETYDLNARLVLKKCMS